MQLWPGAVNFPDFFAQQTIDWWTSQVQSLHNQLPLDGLWIDLAEPSSFCSGDICELPGEWPDVALHSCRPISCESALKFHHGHQVMSADVYEYVCSSDLYGMRENFRPIAVRVQAT